MPKPTPKTALIADDHPLFIKGIRRILEELPWIERILEANDGNECLELVRREKIDFILLDINMPVKDGIECLKEIRQHKYPVKVVAISQYGERPIVRKMFRLGVDGYLLKSVHEDEIVLALEDVVLREKRVSSEAIYSDIPAPRVDLVELTEREREVLRLICDQKTAAQIAATLEISKNTVDNHRVRLLKRADSKSMVGLVKWAYENGLI